MHDRLIIGPRQGEKWYQYDGAETGSSTRRAIALSKRAGELPWRVGRGLHVLLQEEPGTQRVRMLLDFTDAPSTRALREAAPHLMRWVTFLQREQGPTPGTARGWQEWLDQYARPRVIGPRGEVRRIRGATHPELAAMANSLLRQALEFSPSDDAFAVTFLQACGFRGRTYRIVKDAKELLAAEKRLPKDWPVTSDHIEAALRSYRRRTQKGGAR